MAHLRPREGAALLTELGGMAPSASTLDRLPKVLSARWEATREGGEEVLRTKETVPEEAVVFAVSLDGVMPPRAEATPEEEAKPAAATLTAGTHPAAEASASRHDREAGCGTVTLYDDEGDRLSTKRYGRMPEGTQALLGGQLDAECQSLLALRPPLKVVKLADGAEENWRFLAHLALGLSAPERLRVAQGSRGDCSHAADHLTQACEVIGGAGRVQSAAECARLRTLRKEDDKGVDKVLGFLRSRASRLRGRKRAQLEKERTYCRNQRSRMRYAQYRREQLPMGSGVVEAAWKTFVTQRLKRAGMRGRMEGGQAIVTWRGVMQRERWERAWSLLRDDFRKPVCLSLADSPESLDSAA